MKWTDKQRKAIEEEGKILVSAAAGSRKNCGISRKNNKNNIRKKSGYRKNSCSYIYKCNSKGNERKNPKENNRKIRR